LGSPPPIFVWGDFVFGPAGGGGILGQDPIFESWPRKGARAWAAAGGLPFTLDIEDAVKYFVKAADCLAGANIGYDKDK
jgi:hypothetical protein